MTRKFFPATALFGLLAAAKLVAAQDQRVAAGALLVPARRAHYWLACTR